MNNEWMGWVEGIDSLGKSVIYLVEKRVVKANEYLKE